MSGQAFITGLRIGDTEIQVGGAEDKTLRQVSEELGLEWDGTVFIVNGRRLSESEASEYTPKDGDQIEAGRSTKGGR